MIGAREASRAEQMMRTNNNETRPAKYAEKGTKCYRVRTELKTLDLNSSRREDLWNDGNTARLNRVVYPDGGRRVCPQDALENEYRSVRGADRREMRWTD